MLKKIFVAVVAVAFVAGFFANFNSVADAASHVWRCSNCGGQTTSNSTPSGGSCPRSSSGHAWYMVK